MKSKFAAIAVAAFSLSATASAQWEEPAAESGSTASRSDDGLRLALQGRVGAVNLPTTDFGGLVPGPADSAFAPTPLVTAGVRMDRLFLGLGLGLFGWSFSDCDNAACDEEEIRSRSGFSLTPLATYDFLQDDFGALYGAAWVNLASLGGLTIEEIEPGMTQTRELDGAFAWGGNLAVGVRAHLTPGLALGTEWGWGFITWSQDDGGGDETWFGHGLFGNLVLEASVGL